MFKFEMILVPNLACKNLVASLALKRVDVSDGSFDGSNVQIT